MTNEWYEALCALSGIIGFSVSLIFWALICIIFFRK